MAKRLLRKEKEFAVLLGLIEQYLKTGKPVGSGVLQETEFQNLSSATIRNYFAALEEDGYVTQLHTSGGRLPLSKGYEFYAKVCLDEVLQEPIQRVDVTLEPKENAENLIPFLQEAAANISEQLKVGVVLSAPRFDKDSISDIHFHFIDVRRVLAVIVSEFGLVHTQILMPLEAMSPALVRKVDRFAKMRVYKEKIEQDFFEQEEMGIIRRLYQEAVSSFFVKYSSFSEEDMWKVGFSHLLTYPEFAEASSLAASLSLFENNMILRGLFRKVQREGAIRFWLGESLKPFVAADPNCVFVAAPYRVGTTYVGAMGILGPQRVQYRDVFRLLRNTIEQISEALTASLIRQRITYRMATPEATLGDEMRKAVEFCSPKLLEVKEKYE